MFHNYAHDDMTVIVTFDVINRKLRRNLASYHYFVRFLSLCLLGNPGLACSENSAPNLRDDVHTRYKSSYPNLNLKLSTINIVDTQIEFLSLPSYSLPLPVESPHFGCIRRHVGRDACASRMINPQPAPDHVDDLERPPSLSLSSPSDSSDCTLINAQNHRLGSVSGSLIAARYKGNVQKVKEQDF